MLTGGGRSPACSFSSAAASTRRAATFGSEVACAILSSAAAAWRVWKRFCAKELTLVAEPIRFVRGDFVPERKYKGHSSRGDAT